MTAISILGNQSAELLALRGAIEGDFETLCLTPSEVFKKSLNEGLYLIDINSFDVADILRLAELAPNSAFILAQIKSVDSLKPFIMLPQLAGAFSADISAVCVRKGIKLVLNGQLYFPRDFLALILRDFRADSPQMVARAHHLSPKETQVLKLMANGASNNEIADSLNISFHTVKTHVYHIYKKLKVKNRPEASKVGKSLLLC